MNRISLTLLGSDLLHWWEADADHVTLSGALVESVENRGTDGTPLTPADGPSTRPTFNASGGPNDKPYFSGDADDHFIETALASALASNTEVAFFAVCTVPTASYPVDMETSAGTGAKPVFLVFEDSGSDNADVNVFPVSGSNTAVNTGAVDADWHVFSAVYTTASTKVYRDGTLIATLAGGGAVGPLTHASLWFDQGAKVAHMSAVLNPTAENLNTVRAAILESYAMTVFPVQS
jgi:hypothetical protein